MEKVLVSWIAMEKDFIWHSNGNYQVNENGLTISFHREYFKRNGFTKHYILYSSNSDADVKAKKEKLNDYLRLRFKDHSIEFVLMDVDEVYNFDKAYIKVETFINNLKDLEVNILTSSGTTAMRSAWWIIGAKQPNLITLLQIPSGGANKELITYTFTDRWLEQSTNIALRPEVDRQTQTIQSSFQQEAMKRAIEIGRSLATSVLIQGGNGTGKERIAEAVHEYSNRQQEKFAKVNAAAFSDELLRSELFGYAPGAFTGSDRKGSPGLLKQYDNGTLFLDEIGDISPFIQSALLRVLQSGEFYPVGSQKPEKVNVRIIAATNKDLYKMCTEGFFRWDLYYRLSVAEIKTKTVAEMGISLKKEILKYFNDSEFMAYKEAGLRTNQIKISQEVMDVILAYSFPGNIREIENLIRHFYTYQSVDYIEMNHLPARIREITAEHPDRLETVKRKHLELLIKRYGGNISEVARNADISINTVKSILGIAKKKGMA